MDFLTDQRKSFFEENGYLRLGNPVTKEKIEAVDSRVADIMAGKIRYPGMFFQLKKQTDSYNEKHPGNDFYGASNEYRKIKDLEYDPVLLSFFQNPTFHEIARTYIGENVSIMRAMLMNKPPMGGDPLPYHQDISLDWEMSAPPKLTIWVAIDPATKANGCLEVIPGSHRLGRIERGHVVSATKIEDIAKQHPSQFVELAPGEAIVFHNALLHRSGINQTQSMRRGLTLCLMDAAISHTKTGHFYPVLFGENSLTPESVAKLTAIPQPVYGSAGPT